MNQVKKNIDSKIHMILNSTKNYNDFKVTKWPAKLSEEPKMVCDFRAVKMIYIFIKGSLSRRIISFGKVLVQSLELMLRPV